MPVRHVAPGLHVALGLLCVVMLFPVAWTLSTSFKPRQELYEPTLVPASPTLDNYTAALDELPLARLLANTTVMALCVAAGQVLLCLLAAWALERFTFRGKTLAALALIGTMLVPPQTLIIPNYLLVARLGWLDTLPGLVVPQLATTALGVFLLRAHLRAFPRELLEAAELDGASHGQVLWRIVVPNLRAILTALAIVLFIASWNEYLWPLLVTSGEERTTVQVGLQSFQTEEGSAWGPMMAAVSLATGPVVLAYVLAQRQIVDALVRAGIR